MLRPYLITWAVENFTSGVTVTPSSFVWRSMVNVARIEAIVSQTEESAR